jgi:hypothetical protein
MAGKREISSVSSTGKSTSRKDINVGDHIIYTFTERKYFFSRRSYKERHGIYTGESESEVIYLANAESDHTEPVRIVSCSLSEFSKGYKAIPFPYPSQAEASKRPANEVVQTAKFYLKYPYKWQSYKTKPTYSESFVYFCKTGIYKIPEDKTVDTCVPPLSSDDDDGLEIEETDGNSFLDECDDSASRAHKDGKLDHKVKRCNLKIGDHIYVYRWGYCYTHHGIYVGPGFDHGEVIHFSSRSCCTMGGKSNATILSSSLDEFLLGEESELRLVIYNASGLQYFATRGETMNSRKSKTAREVIHTAKYYLKNPSKWEKYNLRENNCESFATFCKVGIKTTYQGERFK